MSFARGVLSAGAVDLRTAIENYMPTNGWTSVENYVDGSSNDIHVWKNPAANNSAGIDFYVVLAIKSGAANGLVGLITEQYTAGTHIATRYASSYTSTMSAGTAAGNLNNTDNSGTIVDTTGLAPFGAGTGPLTWQGTSHTVTAGAGYAVSVTSDRIYAFGGMNQGGLAIGRFGKRNSNSLDTCLGSLSLNASLVSANSNTMGFWTRLPAPPASSTYGMQLTVAPDQYMISSTSDRLTGRTRATKVLLGEVNSTQTIRAELADVLCAPGVAAYDDDLSITVGGVTKTYGYIGGTVVGSAFWVDKSV